MPLKQIATKPVAPPATGNGPTPAAQSSACAELPGIRALSSPTPLPWAPGITPLFLAPMQGLTNHALRALFIDWVRPDVVFTEYLRVNPAAPGKRLSAVDLREATATRGAVPLVAQLIGHGREPLVAAALAAQDAGALHINLNLGCPYGRMSSGRAGGKLLQRAELLADLIPALRQAVTGSLSVKLRAGYDDPSQIFALLHLFEAAGVDFLVLHPRTVVQKYAGYADHSITAEVVRRTHLPVIANGDIRNAATGLRTLQETGAAGLMLGRGAIADPLLFERLRGRANPDPGELERAAQLGRYLLDLLQRYRTLFCGDVQILGKLKGVLETMEDPCLAKNLKQLRKAPTLRAFSILLEALG